MITRIEADRYRCFDRLAVDLGAPPGMPMPALSVIVGANGAGKTTFLDIPVLLADLLNAKQVSAAFLQSSGGQAPRAVTLRELVHQGRGQCFSFAVEAQAPGEPALGVRYELCLELIEHHELRVRNEYLFTFSAADQPSHESADTGSCLLGETHPNPAWHFMLRREPGGDSVFRFETPAAGETRARVPPERLALARVQFEGRDAFPISRWLFDLLIEQALFFAPDWIALRAACPPGQPDRLLADGRNLPWLARRLRADDPERFASWREHVAVALPQVTDIEALEREEDHHAYLRLSYQHGYQVTSSGLSEGTLRILALTLIPYLPARPRLLIVEEPENGIHPRAIEAVLQSLASVYDSQVLLSSHSPVVVAQTPLAQLLVARLADNGAVTLVAGSRHPRLAHWKGQLDLGQLFAAGVLG